MNHRRLRLCLEFMKGNLGLYIGALICLLINVALGFVSPRVLGWTIDSFIGDTPLHAPAFVVSLVEQIGGRSVIVRNLWICMITLVLVSAFNGLFSFLYAKWSAQASENIAENIRNRLYEHLQPRSFQYHVTVETGARLQRCSSDVETVRRFLSSQLMQIVRAVSLVVIALSIMLPLSLKMTGVAVIIVPPIFLFSLFYFRKVIATFRDADEAEGAMSACLQENLTGMRVVRAFGRQAYEIDKFTKKSEDLRDKFWRVNRVANSYWAISDGIVAVQRALLLVAGVYFVVRGEITVGVLTVFVSYENQLLWPVRQLGRVLADMGKAMVSLERIDQVLREKSEFIDEGKCLEPPLDADVHFENVTFGYETGKPVLDGVTFTAKAGQTVAILGSTGSGKSTMMYLMQRLYDYQSGSITIGGVELRDIDKKYLRTHVGIVLQEPFLYSKTVRENIAIVDPALPDQAVFDAARTAAVHDVIQEFDAGYETMVGERGVTLSGGQKQRVSIARTLLKDNDILIFDDSLSAVDTETDAKIREALRRGRTATTFIVAHRITTLMQADLILVMDQGKIAQQGTHAQLIQCDGLYQRIFHIQTALEDELGNETA